MLSDKRPEWADLARHARTMTDIPAAAPARDDAFILDLPGLRVDVTRHRATRDTMALLGALAKACDVALWRDRMMEGDKINVTEDRAVLHTALRRRAGDDVRVDGKNVMPGIHATLDKMQGIVAAIRNGTWTGHSGKTVKTVVNIGIGGSDLGPRMVVEALRAHHIPGLDVRFVANIDGADLHNALNGADPETTLFLIASKTFTTQETMLNAAAAKRWIAGHYADDAAVARHFIALSSNAPAVRDFGIPETGMLTFESWVGGRYSLWSPVGLSIALAIGFDGFRALLDGARAMDVHFATAPLDRNAPVVLGLLGVWYRNFHGMGCHAVLPYDQGLARFPAWLQQTDMESNGKRVTRDGVPVAYGTGPVVFGEPGTNAQHAFCQLLHQGTDIIPCDFIAARESSCACHDNHKILLANMLAQADGLAFGQADSDPARSFPGNRPSSVILLDRMDPFHLGMLLALYEHKIFVQGIVWGINSFDQFGVGLGKILANERLAAGKPL